ncbi:MAG: ATP phosphoribosyltransferase [Firmicutes bacterium]|nr:ATP phosphoribosyltransferase [Bacillota bacterium]
MSYNVTIAVAKGRTLEAVRQRWLECGWDWPESSNSRQLWFPPDRARPGLIVARGADIPMLVQRGIAEFGIVGLDMLREHPTDGVLEVLDLDVAHCRLALAGAKMEWPDGPARIATKYQRVARDFFRRRSHPVEIVPLSGSLELAPAIGLAPYIVDVVQTGATLKAHGLYEISTVFHSSARLIANAAVWRTGNGMLSVYEQWKAVTGR